MKKSLYDVLEVASDATPEEIKEAFIRQTARSQAADLGDQIKFAKDAYDILSNPTRRQAYDASLLREPPPQIIYVEEQRGLSLPMIALAGVIVLGAIWFYIDHQQRQDKMRIEAAALAIQKQQALEAERLAQEKARQEHIQTLEERRWEFQQRAQEEANKEVERRRQDMQLRDQERQATQEEYRRRIEEQRQQREAAIAEERSRRQAESEARRQKAWVEQAERERYGYRR